MMNRFSGIDFTTKMGPLTKSVPDGRSLERHGFEPEGMKEVVWKRYATGLDQWWGSGHRWSALCFDSWQYCMPSNGSERG